MRSSSAVRRDITIQGKEKTDCTGSFNEKKIVKYNTLQIENCP